MKKYPSTDSVLLGIILLAGATLRFFNYQLLPYSYDEFSALFRTQFDNFGDLIRFGVIETDTHPAGIQVFLYYWVRLFGEGEEAVKLPFTLAGLGAVYLTYRIASAWFNTSVGLISASFLSFLQYPVTYSQFARPYVSGLLFVLLLVWSFQNAFVKREGKWKYHAVIYVLAGAACAYNHHFSLFFLGVAGVTGLFLVPRKRLGILMACNILIFLLYIPHLEIFFTQLGKGGVESWLRKPEPGFFIDYLSYLLHFSRVMYIAVILMVLGSLYYARRTTKEGNGYRLLMVLWIAVTWITAYYYSVYRSSVLQFSVLIFTFPFLVILAFSFVGKLKDAQKAILVVSIGVLSIYTLVVNRQHYRVQYRSVLEQTFANTAAARSVHGQENVACATNISPKVQEYYHGKYGVDPETVITFDSTTSFLEFRETLMRSPAQYLAIGWVNISRLEFFAVAREVFPVMLKKESYYTGDFYLLSRSGMQPDTARIDDTRYNLRLDSLDIYLNSVTSGYPLIFEHNRLLQPGWMSFTNLYGDRLGNCVEGPDRYLFLTMEIENPQPEFESKMICEIIRDQEVVYWTARPFYQFTLSDWGRYRIHLALKLADLDFDLSRDYIKVYLENTDEAYYYINYFNIKVSEGNPMLYSLFQKIRE